MNIKYFYYDGVKFKMEWPKGCPKETPYTACVEFGKFLSKRDWVGKSVSISISLTNGFVSVEFYPIAGNIKNLIRSDAA